MVNLLIKNDFGKKTVHLPLIWVKFCIFVGKKFLIFKQFFYLKLVNLSVNLPKWCLAVNYATLHCLHWSFDRWEVKAWFSVQFTDWESQKYLDYLTMILKYVKNLGWKKSFGNKIWGQHFAGKWITKWKSIPGIQTKRFEKIVKFF